MAGAEGRESRVVEEGGVGRFGAFAKGAGGEGEETMGEPGVGTRRSEDEGEEESAGGLGGKAGVSRGRKGLREKVMWRGME